MRSFAKIRCKKAMLSNDKKVRTEILNDIDKLQLSKNKTTFEMVTKLFLKKWANQERFVQYFSNEWIGLKNGWYKGLEIYVPSTNNALKATNRVIKDEDTVRERLVLSRFTVVALSIVKKWSKERNPTGINSKTFEHQSSIPLSCWTDGYNWVKLNKEVISILNGDRTEYY